jgi:hypothetical protein
MPLGEMASGETAFGEMAIHHFNMDLLEKILAAISCTVLQNLFSIDSSVFLSVYSELMSMSQHYTQSTPMPVSSHPMFLPANTLPLPSRHPIFKPSHAQQIHQIPSVSFATEQ